VIPGQPQAVPRGEAAGLMRIMALSRSHPDPGAGSGSACQVCW
jgi:hypothetical protein